MGNKSFELRGFYYRSSGSIAGLSLNIEALLVTFILLQREDALGRTIPSCVSSSGGYKSELLKVTDVLATLVRCEDPRHYQEDESQNYAAEYVG